MKKIFIIPAVAFSILFSACSEEQKKEISKPDDAQNAFILKKQPVSVTLDLPAELLPFEEAEIHAKVDGYVQSVLADIGDKVKKGQVLARIDAPEVAAQAAQAGAKFVEARANFEASMDKYNRIQNAAKQQGVISESEVINAINQMKADSAALASSQSASQAYRQLQEYLTIRAPFEGIVTSRTVNPGDLTGKSGKSVMFVVQNPKKLRLRVYVPETHVGNLPSSDTLSFSVDAAANRIYQAKLSRKSGSISRETRTETWEFEFDNTSGELKPGMYTTVKLNLNRPASSFVVPFSSVVTTLEKKFVIRINKGQTEWVDVRDGISMKSGKEIFGNLSENDTILVRGSDEIKPETPLKVKIQ
jgi:membrane fusion protein, multidrug efflux system